jgi:hypothetical protein
LQCYQLDHYLTLSLPRQSMVQPQVELVVQAVELAQVVVLEVRQELRQLMYPIARMSQLCLLRQI